MSAEFPDFFHSHWRPPPYELCEEDKEWIKRDWVRNFFLADKRDKSCFYLLSFITPTTNGYRVFDKWHGIDTSRCPEDVKAEIQEKLCLPQKDFKHGRSPYIINGVPIADVLKGSAQFPCDCRSDVIFYNGRAYDQKYFLQARLRTRPCNVMFLEGKLIPPFMPGKSPQILGPYRNRDKPPINTGFNNCIFGKGLNPCCTTSIFNDTVPPYHNTKDYGYTRMGLPYGETIGFFRFKPKKICDCRQVPLQSLGECCTCEPGEYNPAQYIQDECPPACCC
ncbi:hypothetical protein BgiMline_017982 [Biomphalaria glabrata]|nr:hypothetical protein BgiMline_005606 [Biomphalaria glabrata]